MHCLPQGTFSELYFRGHEIIISVRHGTPSGLDQDRGYLRKKFQHWTATKSPFVTAAAVVAAALAPYQLTICRIHKEVPLLPYWNYNMQETHKCRQNASECSKMGGSRRKGSKDRSILEAAWTEERVPQQIFARQLVVLSKQETQIRLRIPFSYSDKWRVCVCACAERVEHDDAVMRPTSEAETPTLQGSQESPIEWDHEHFFKPQNWSRNWVSDLQCPWKRHWLWWPYHMATKASIEIHALPKKHQVQREICLDWNRMILDHCIVQYTKKCKLSHKISQVHTTPPKDSKCLAGSSKVNTDGIYCKIRGASMSKPTCMTSGKGSAPESMRSTKIQATLAQRPRAWSWVAIPVWHRHTCPTSNIHNALSLQVVYR